MKKLVAVLLVTAMTMSFAACSKKDTDKDEETEVTEEETIEETEEITEATEEETTEESSETVDPNAKHDPQYWCDFYGQNRCPFSINVNGESKQYYFRNGGTLAGWTFTEENTDGWYLLNGYVISADSKYAINLDEADAFSSFCEYEAKPYNGDYLNPEDAQAQQKGVFYCLNSYSPISTNWGIQLMTEGGYSYNDNNVPDLTYYDDLACEFEAGEQIRFYVKWVPDWTDNPEAVKLWAVKHQERSAYGEFFTAEEQANAYALGEFKLDENDNSVCVASIPADAEPGEYDLLVTYGDTNNLVVGVVLVEVREV